MEVMINSMITLVNSKKLSPDAKAAAAAGLPNSLTITIMDDKGNEIFNDNATLRESSKGSLMYHTSGRVPFS